MTNGIMNIHSKVRGGIFTYYFDIYLEFCKCLTDFSIGLFD